MAQQRVQDLKIDYSRDYQPLTQGPGGGFFTFKALDGAGGKRIATVAYLIPTGRRKGEYNIEIANKQAGKGRLSAYNESLARDTEKALLNTLRYDLLRKGWRETTKNTWVCPEYVVDRGEAELLPVPEGLEAPAPLTVAESREVRAAQPGSVKETVTQLMEAAENLSPNQVMLVSLPKDVYVVLMHGQKFAAMMDIVARANTEQ